MPSAQQAGTNVNVLPIVTDGNGNPITPAQDGAVPFKGDYYLQRQLEPTIAVSTRNPNHLVAFFNDYRAVDIPDDVGLGETTAGPQTGLAGLIAKLFRHLARRPKPAAVPPLAAAAEAWVGMGRSYDGGWTWSGALAPGSPFDGSPASMASPLKGLEAATDPVAVSAPCGYFHVALLGFTRGGTSRMVVLTYQDENDSEGGESIHYKYTTVLESGNNAEHGYFLDKPDIVADVDRSGSADSCAYNLYVSYTTFNGLTKDNKFQSKITFARSSNRGQSFTTQKLNQTYNQSQGTALAIDPRPGTPASGGGTVYLFWRHFYTPDTILVARSTNYGQTFSKPLEVPGTPLAAFDQPTFSTATTLNPPAEIAFRSNGFPTAVVTGSGAVFVAWQERVGIDPGAPGALGRPLAGGSPRIVMMRSVNGATWTDLAGVAGQRLAVDMSDRDHPADPNQAPPGFGALPTYRASGPQVMPRLSAGGGRLLLTYYESRGLLGYDAEGRATFLPADTNPPQNGFIKGIDRVMDLRGTLLDPTTGALLGGTQISRYPIRAGANLADGEQLEDVEAVSAPCFPDDPGASTPCVRRVNRVNAPHSAAGTSPFIGDYTGAAPAVSFVPDGAGGWKWATAAADVPFRAFRTVWADNRNLVPPTEPANVPEWQRYAVYGTPGTGGSSCNAGSRNSDVLTSLVGADLVVSMPTTFKQLGGIKRAFPIYLQNSTSATRYFRYTFAAGAPIASFNQFSTELKVVDAMVLPFSGETRVVYVSPDAQPTESIQVRVHEIDGIPDSNNDGVADSCVRDQGCGGTVIPGGLTGGATINIDPSNPAVGPAAESYNPLQPNPLQPNPLQPNPLQPNPLQPNPLQPNITASNPALDDATIYGTQTTVWSIENVGNTAGAYTTDLKIDNPSQYDGSYVFQQVVYKVTPVGSLVGCDTSPISTVQVIASTPMSTFALNPLQPNPLQPNPLQPNPLQPNPLQPNTTLAMSPPAEGVAQNSHDGTMHAPRGSDKVYVAFIAYQVVPSPPSPFDPLTDPPSITVISQAVNTDGSAPIAFTAPDLVIKTAPTALPDSVLAGGSVEVSGWTLGNTGTATANSEDGSFTHGAYLSADAALDESDVALGLIGTSVAPLAAGGTAAFGAVSLTIPDVSPGAYYLLFAADDQREVSEFAETDNVVTAALTVLDPNVPPVAESQTVATSEDTPVEITLTATDANGDMLTFSVLDGPFSGALAGAAPALTYAPVPNYHGTDSFTFAVSDGQASSAAATVTIAVVAANDGPVAAPDAVTTQQNGQAVTISVLANDVDPEGDVLNVMAVTQPSAGGTATVASPNVTYKPALNFTGVDTFTYTASDGNGGIAIGAVTVTVQDGIADYGFIGLLSPWTGDSSTAKIGSSFPIVWRYTDAETSLVVNSAAARPEVIVKGPFNCTQGETSSTLQRVAYPGNSGFQYSASTNTWQFNWQTTELTQGCYNIRIYSEVTFQSNGPFGIRLRK